MAKNKIDKYWENEEGDIFEFGKNFMRFYDKSGKLQFGKIFQNKDGEKIYLVKFVIDRNELFNTEENESGADVLMGGLDMWQEIYDGEDHED